MEKFWYLGKWVSERYCIITEEDRERNTLHWDPCSQINVVNLAREPNRKIYFKNKTFIYYGADDDTAGI